MADLESPERLSNDEVLKLIYVAEAGIKEKRGGLRTLGIPVKKRYNLDEQLTAISRLGDSNSPIALGYLTNLSKIVPWHKSPDPHYHDFDYGGSTCPNAKGELRIALISRYSGQKIDKCDERAVKIINTAISKLEKAVKIQKE
jgi:hypothetical protein